MTTLAEPITVATTGGSIAEQHGNITPGTLRHVASYVGRAAYNSSLETRTGLAPQHPLTLAHEITAFAAALSTACELLAAGHPGTPPPSARELLTARKHFCDGTLSVSIEVYEYVPVDIFAVLFA